MPLHLPRFGSSSDKKSKDESPPSFITSSESRGRSVPTSPILRSSSPLALPSRSTTHTSGSGSISPNSQSNPPAGILRHTTSQSTSSNSDYQSVGASAKRLSGLNFGRTETIDTISSFDDDRDRDRDRRFSNSGISTPSTPGTSVSSFSSHPPLPAAAAGKFPFFMMTLSSTSTLSFIALPPSMRAMVIAAVERAWKKGVGKVQQVDYQPELMKKHKDKGCEGGVWEITLKSDAWMPTSSEQVSSKRIVLHLLTEFAREGYNLSSSFRTSAKDSGKDTLIFSRDEQEPDPDPIFFAVAFYSHDRIWIIDAEADVGEALEEGIKTWWVDGIRDARVRERHCREIRLRGAPWTAHSTTSLISARCIHLTIMKLVTHCETGYDFVGSVDMADKEEGEMPVTFYRRKWGKTRAVWSQITMPSGSRSGSGSSADGSGSGLGMTQVQSQTLA